MAVNFAKSTVISNRDAVPKVLTDASFSGGGLKSSQGYVQTVSATDSANSIYRLCQVPSNARVESVKLQCDALGGSGAGHVGVYYPTYIPPGLDVLAGIQPNQVINASFFASAQSLVSAIGPTDVTNQSGSNTIAKQEMCLWQALGLSADPGIDLDVCVTISTAIASQGYVGLKVQYSN